MRIFSLALLSTLLALPHPSNAAGFKDVPVFSEQEKSQHLMTLNTLMESAAGCLEADITRHKQFLKKYDVSAFYGDNTDFARKIMPDGTKVLTTKAEKREILREKYGVKDKYINELIPAGECKGGLKECPNMMQNTSCIGLVMKCLKKGFQDAGQEKLWQKLRLYALANGVRGDVVQDGLQKLGLKILYWNPDTEENESWDKKDQRRYPDNPQNIWGQHVASWESVRTRQRYYFNKVDDYHSLVDFRKDQPEFMKRVPFFVGIAHLGYHVFPGTYGEVVEGHSARDLDDKETVEKSEFNPIRRGGGPRGGEYNSGLIAIPPGYLEETSRDESRDQSSDDFESDFLNSF
jgi:hypothetical protein